MTREAKDRGLVGWAIVIILVLGAVVGAIGLMTAKREKCVDYIARPGAAPPCFRSEETHFEIVNGVPMCLCPGSPYGSSSNHQPSHPTELQKGK